MVDENVEEPSGTIGFEWDENKRRSNLEKHGIDFGDAKEVFSDAAAYTYVSRQQDAEQRHVIVGLVGAVLIAVISTLRGSITRIISARMARREERRLYERKDRKEDQ